MTNNLKYRKGNYFCLQSNHHMDSKVIKKCQWKPCEIPASKHARFGNRIFNGKDLEPKSTAPFTVMHRNCCSEHAVEIRKQYLEAVFYDIGKCPTCNRPDL